MFIFTRRICIRDRVAKSRHPYFILNILVQWQKRKRNRITSTFFNLWSGYGDFYPATPLGKGLCVVYAIFGIPITILLLRFIGQQMLRAERSLITGIEKHCMGRNGAPSCLNEKCFMFGFMYLLLLLLIGAVVQMKAEGWSYGDSLYFYVVTFTTVGFGDLLPQEAKYITVPFILLALTAISNILHAAAAVALIKRVTAGSQEKDKTDKLTEKAAEV